MLEQPTDTERVREWLAAAMAPGSGKTAAGLARFCGVTAQAVNGWRTTGRITKVNLEKAAAFLGSRPDFGPRGATVLHARESSPSYGAIAWPFRTVDAAKVAALAHDDLMRLEGAILAAAAQLGLPSIRKRRAA